MKKNISVSKKRKRESFVPGKLWQDFFNDRAKPMRRTTSYFCGIGHYPITVDRHGVLQQVFGGDLGRGKFSFDVAYDLNTKTYTVQEEKRNVPLDLILYVVQEFRRF